MKNLKVLFTIIASLLTIGIKAQHMDHMGHMGNMNSMNHEGEKMQTQNVDAMFQIQLALVIHTVGDLSEAFVSGKAVNVSNAASVVKDALNSVDMSLLKGEDHMKWMQYLHSMNEQLKIISESRDLSMQKESFAAFNETLYTGVKTFGIQGNPAYYQFCPMAFNNKGAYWFSNAEKIRNPYFGDQMLTCGSIKEVFTK